MPLVTNGCPPKVCDYPCGVHGENVSKNYIKSLRIPAVFGDESRCGNSAAEKLDFKCFRDVSPKDWNLIIEVEVVLNSCAQYALGVTHKDATITFPFTLYFRSLLQRCFDAPSFQCLKIGSKPEHDATEFSQVRVTKLKADFSEEGQVCIDRCLGQLKARFPTSQCIEYAKGMIMDPRTKALAQQFMEQLLC